MTNFGSDKLYQVHDLIYDVIRSRANEFGFCHVLEEKKSTFIEGSRRLSIYDNVKIIMETIEDNCARSMVHKVDRKIGFKDSSCFNSIRWMDLRWGR